MSGFKVKFDKKKSKYGQIGEVRLMENAVQKLRLKKAREEQNALDSMFRIESANALDRMVDVHYDNYKDEFNEYMTVIERNLKYAMAHSNVITRELVFKLQEKYSMVCEDIKYLHATGNKAELENVKRQAGYEKAVVELKGLVDSSAELVINTYYLK